MSLGDTLLQLFFVVLVPLFLVSALALLYFYVSTFRSMCAVPNMAVFCNSLTSWFPGMSFTYFLNDLEMVPVAPIITGITLAFTFHMRCIPIARSLYFKILSASFLIIIIIIIIIIPFGPKRGQTRGVCGKLNEDTLHSLFSFVVFYLRTLSFTKMRR